MMKITIVGTELFDPDTDTFLYPKTTTVTLEHSLVSISKWESKWKKSFLSDGPSTGEEVMDYVKCMTLTQNVDPNIYRCLRKEDYDRIFSYINEPQTATTIRDDGKKKNGKKITSEEIYAIMSLQGIPWDAAKWHFSRLMMLIRVCEEYSKPSKKMNKKDAMAQQRALNASRRKASGSRG